MKKTLKKGNDNDQKRRQKNTRLGLIFAGKFSHFQVIIMTMK